MEKFTGLSFSLTKEDINLLLIDNDKLKKKNKRLALGIIFALVLTISINVYGFYYSNSLLFFSSILGGGSFLGLLTNNLSINLLKLKQYNTKMEQLKIDFQRLVGPNRIVNGKSFRLEKSNNVVKDLKKYSFLEQEVGIDCVTRSKQIVNDNLFVGTVSRQYVAVDDSGIVGAINEVKYSDVERTATKDGCIERVVTRCEYSLCGADEVRPYKSKPLVRKKTNNVNNPQGR